MNSTSIHIVAEPQVVRVWRFAAYFKDLLDIIELS